MELLIVIIVLALLFDFINGFHDAANSIATIVSTKVLTPFQAVLWAAFFNFVAFFIAKYIIGVVVSESGASIYSASKVAREEFPEHDVTVRGAVSIGRRLMYCRPGDAVLVKASHGMAFETILDGFYKAVPRD